MKESHSESLASHTGPESCGVPRKGDAEALTGESAGQVTESRKTLYFGTPTPFGGGGRQHPRHRYRKGLRSPARSKTLARTDTSHTGTGRSRVLPERSKPGRIGKSKDVIPMMNEHGKSDGFIVPEKSPNKAGADKALVAEGMEGRNPTKGNSSQQNTCRTQCREHVYSALERVRSVARKDKQAQFTALLHHIYDRKTLEFAYLSMEKSASPGVDGETWQHYGEALEDNLQSLSQRLTLGAYNLSSLSHRPIARQNSR